MLSTSSSSSYSLLSAADDDSILFASRRSISWRRSRSPSASTTSCSWTFIWSFAASILSGTGRAGFPNDFRLAYSYPSCPNWVVLNVASTCASSSQTWNVKKFISSVYHWTLMQDNWETYLPLIFVGHNKTLQKVLVESAEVSVFPLFDYISDNSSRLLRSDVVTIFPSPNVLLIECVEVVKFKYLIGI